MKIVGLTGGIGSGKTTISKMFEKLGVSVYNSDIEAKKLTNTSTKIRKELTELLGEDAYKEDALNRKYVANLIFNDKLLLEKVNAIIHPRVAKHFKEWCKKQSSPYVIKESALLFETNSYKNIDFTILITSPVMDRVKRVIKRDSISEKEIKDRINNQLPDAEKVNLADFVIENIDLSITEEKVKEIHLFLLNS